MKCPACKEDYVVVMGLKPIHDSIYQGKTLSDYIKDCVCTKCGHKFEKPISREEVKKWE